jgi:spermidine synthase
LVSDATSADSLSQVNEQRLTAHQTGWLLLSVLIVALCGIAYELIIAAVSSYLLGNSIAQFSITIGLFMFAMGIGSYLTKFIHEDLVERFIQIEIAVALVGGLSAALLFVVFPYYALYKPVMYSLILAIGTLVGLEIPLLTRILSRATSFSESLAHVLSLDYIGALIGSVGFPLLLLPSLGLFRSSFAIGLLNISVAIIALSLLGRSHPKVLRLWKYAIFVIGLLFTGLLASTWITSYAEGQLFANEIIFTKQTTYQRIVLTSHPRNGEVRLYLDGHLQFAGLDEHRYHESLVHPVMSTGTRPAKVLVLGGGDGLAIREITKFAGVESIELVDIDASVTELASKFGPIRNLNRDSLLDPRVKIIHTDAFNYVQQAYERLKSSGDWYDRIIIDLPDPHSEVLNKLYCKEFYGLIFRILKDDGSFVTQSGSPLITREAFWCIAETIKAAGFKVLPYQTHLNSFGEWGFQLCVKQNSIREPSQLKLQNASRRYLTDEVFQASQTFSGDNEPIPSPVNSLFEPKLYLLYEAGLNR